jgi:hypothetical protein
LTSSRQNNCPNEACQKAVFPSKLSWVDIIPKIGGFLLYTAAICAIWQNLHNIKPQPTLPDHIRGKYAATLFTRKW